MANTTGKKFGGRQKGTPNKATEKSRELFQEIMAGNVKHVKTALEEVYNEDKKQYLNLLSKYFPYFVPRKEQVDIAIESESLSFDIKIESRKKTNTE